MQKLLLLLVALALFTGCRTYTNTDVTLQPQKGKYVVTTLPLPESADEMANIFIQRKEFNYASIRIRTLYPARVADYNPKAPKKKIEAALREYYLAAVMRATQPMTPEEKLVVIQDLSTIAQRTSDPQLAQACKDTIKML